MFAGSIPALGTFRNRDSRWSYGTSQITIVLVEQRSARLPVTQEIVGSNPIGGARATWHGTQTEKRRSSNLRDRLWVRLPPVLLTGLCSSRPAVNRLSQNKRGGRREVQFLHDPLKTWPVRLMVQDARPSISRYGFDSRTGCFTWPSGGTGIHAALRTPCPQGRASSNLALATSNRGRRVINEDEGRGR